MWKDSFYSFVWLCYINIFGFLQPHQPALKNTISQSEVPYWIHTLQTSVHMVIQRGIVKFAKTPLMAEKIIQEKVNKWSPMSSETKCIIMGLFHR